jgi:hypothetical protein
MVPLSCAPWATTALVGLWNPSPVQRECLAARWVKLGPRAVVYVLQGTTAQVGLDNAPAYVRSAFVVCRPCNCGHVVLSSLKLAHFPDLAELTITPTRCDPTLYCPTGADAPLLLPPGYFYNTTGVDAPKLLPSSCVPGQYCVNGTAFACPVGTHNPRTLGTSFADCLGCEGGWFCGACLTSCVTKSSCALYHRCVMTPLFVGSYRQTWILGCRIGCVCDRSRRWDRGSCPLWQRQCVLPSRSSTTHPRWAWVLHSGFVAPQVRPAAVPQGAVLRWGRPAI